MTDPKLPKKPKVPEGIKNAERKPKAKPKGNPPHDNVGRNNALIDWKFVDQKLAEGCSGMEIAASIGINMRTLYTRCKKDRKMNFEELAQTMRSKGVAFAKSAFFRKAFIEKDTASAIFWMKNNAGWSDKRQVESTVNVNQSAFEDLVGGVDHAQSGETEST